MIKYIAKRIICLFYKIKYFKKVTIHISSTILGNCIFEGRNKIGAHNYLRNVNIGLFTNIGDNNQFSFAKIGRFCSIGSNITLITATHPLNLVSTHHIFYKSIGHKESFNEKDLYNDRITIDNGLSLDVGNDVWIGDRVIIKGGIHIKDGAVIGMGAVVTKDVPPYAIVGGNPAKIIRYRFEASIVEQLLEIEWWNWPKDKIKEKAILFLDLQKFINKENTKY